VSADAIFLGVTFILPFELSLPGFEFDHLYLEFCDFLILGSHPVPEFLKFVTPVHGSVFELFLKQAEFTLESPDLDSLLIALPNQFGVVFA
jgi:hypothetical protein